MFQWYLNIETKLTAIINCITVILLQHLTPISSLECYDTWTQHPTVSKICSSKDQVCYSEFYTVRWTTGEVDHIFDRFCVHITECTYRGFYPNCLSLPDLDEKVQQTFFAQQAKTYKKRIDKILHSRFCCCNTTKCNGYDLDNAKRDFNVTELNSCSGIWPPIWALIIGGVLQTLLPPTIV